MDMKRILIIFAIFFSISAFSQEEKAVKTDRNDISIEIGGGNVYYLLNLEEGYDDLTPWKYQTWNNYSIYFRASFRVCCFTLGWQLKYATKNMKELIDSTPYKDHSGDCFIISGFERYDLISNERFKLSPCIAISIGYQSITIANVSNNKSFDYEDEDYIKLCSSIQYDFLLESSIRLQNTLWLKLSPFYNYTFNYDDHYDKPMHDKTSKSFGLNIGLEWYIW